MTIDIEYDRRTREYVMHLRSVLVGYARTYHEAELVMNTVSIGREVAIQALRERYPSEADAYVADAEERMGIGYWTLITSVDELVLDVELYIQAKVQYGQASRG